MSINRLSEIPTIEILSDIAIVIFPSRPYWFSITPEIKLVIDLFYEGDNHSIIHGIMDRLNVSHIEAEETFSAIQSLLYENGVLSIDGEYHRGIEIIEPHFQVNAVENVLVISATQGCNLACNHCYANASQKPVRNEMTTEEIKNLIVDLNSMPWKNEVSSIGLTGGEFFLRQDALELIDYIHRDGFRILVSSNGLLLTEDMIIKLSAYPNLKISISLDGPTASVHEFIRGENTFERTISTIRKLTEKGVFVGINMFVHQRNINLIGETLALAENLGVKTFNCLNMMSVGRANSRRGKKELVRVPENVLHMKLFEILRNNSQFRELMRNSTFANQVMGIAGGIKSHYCGIGTNRALYVKANGTIYPCPDTALPRFQLGNIKERSLSNIWENSPILQELRSLDVDTMNPFCAKCDVRYLCGGGCRGENYQVTKELESPHFNCLEIRRSILGIMWMLTEEPDLFQDKVHSLHQSVCIGSISFVVLSALIARFF